MCLLLTYVQTNTFKCNVTQSCNVPNNFMLFSYVRLDGLKMSFDKHLSKPVIKITEECVCVCVCVCICMYVPRAR